MDGGLHGPDGGGLPPARAHRLGLDLRPLSAQGSAALPRVGAVSYLNARPLTAALEGAGGLDLVTGTPAAVARGLRDGSLDLGLVPAVELLRDPALEPVPGLGIAALGEVWSVLLLLRKAPREIRDLVLDPDSRTSSVLARIILEQGHGVRPRPRAPRGPKDRGDARLVIGDPALAWHAQEHPRLDLGGEYFRLTGLPMVFAVWAGRRDSRARWKPLLPALASAADWGLEQLSALAAGAAAALRLPAAFLEVYLRERIRYRLGAAEAAGLETFLDLARPHLAD